MNKSQGVSQWRLSEREEIIEYYQTEFPKSLSRMPGYLTPEGPREYAISFGESNYYPTLSSHRSSRNFIRRKTRGESDNGVYFSSFEDLAEFFVSPAHHDPLREYGKGGYLADPATVDQQPPVSRAVYYHVRDWNENWLLVFDIDAKDVARRAAREMLPGADSLSEEQLFEKSGIMDAPPSDYKYTFEHVEKAIKLGFEIESILTDCYEYSETQVVYSGQGCHVYGLDVDRPHKYDQEARQVILYHLVEQLEYPLDEVVTKDSNRVIRLPYSLHTDVSRIVTPIESPTFDPQKQAIPSFMEGQQ